MFFVKMLPFFTPRCLFVSFYQRAVNFPDAPEPLHSPPSATHLAAEHAERCGIQQGVQHDVFADR